MTPHWCELYLTRDNYRQAWDEGRGPGQTLPVSPEPVEPPPRYTAEDQAFALSLCHACKHCRGGVCRFTKCGRLKVPCAVRVTMAVERCPEGKW